MEHHKLLIRAIIMGEAAEMNYRIVMKKSVNYIESNIKENLTAQMIAEYSGYSLYHFGRIFLAYYGMSVMEYVLRRRLSLAIHDIYNGAKMLDTALLYGFETASGFSKAFRRHYHTSATQYLKNYENFQNETFKNEDGISNEILNNNVRFEIKEAFKIIGYSIKNIKGLADSTKELAASWLEMEYYELDDLEAYLYETLNPPKHEEVCVLIPDEKGECRYILGLVVDSFDKAEDDMICVEIPKGNYAVFTTIPINTLANPGYYQKIIKKTWKGIFDNWFNDNKYELDFDKLDFEYYDERSHSEVSAMMEIWIPIKERLTKK